MDPNTALRKMRHGGGILTDAQVRRLEDIGMIWDDNNSCSNVFTSECIKRLDNIGMVWKKSNSVWERYYNVAVEYYAEHGNIDVPAKYITKDGLKLGNWLNRQRQIKKGNLKKSAPLTEEQTERLEMLGMTWGVSMSSNGMRNMKLHKNTTTVMAALMCL